MIRFADRFFRKRFSVRECDPGRFRQVNRLGMRFFFDAYDIDGAGHLGTIRMKAMFGLIRMESVIFTPYYRDVPLFSADLLRAPGKNTLLMELYDIQIDPLPEEAVRLFSELKERYSWLKDYSVKEQWSDSLLFPQSAAKSGEKRPDIYEEIFREYLRAYVKVLRRMPACDPAEKHARVKAYTDGLLQKGGNAVNNMKKFIGEEATAELVNRILFGCDQSR